MTSCFLILYFLTSILSVEAYDLIWVKWVGEVAKSAFW